MGTKKVKLYNNMLYSMDNLKENVEIAAKLVTRQFSARRRKSAMTELTVA